MKALLALALAALLVAPSATAQDSPPPELLLLVNGRILRSPSAGEGRTWVPTRFAEAALAQDGRFVAVGTTAEMEVVAARYAVKPKRIDLRGRFAVGGLTDAHGHVSGLGFALQRLRFEGTTSADQIAKMVAAEAKKRRAGEWILGRG